MHTHIYIYMCVYVMQLICIVYIETETCSVRLLHTDIKYLKEKKVSNRKRGGTWTVWQLYGNICQTQSNNEWSRQVY